VSFILASASAARRRVLAGAGVPFAVMPAEIDESALKDRLLARGVGLADIAGELAEAKALAVSRANSGALALGADQILLFDGELVSKCPDLKAARALLDRLRGKPHTLISALVLARDGIVIWRHVETPRLIMRHFSDAFLDAYLAAEGAAILPGVGCYKVEGLGAQLFESIEGDYFAIQGLPLQPLLAELRRQGVIAI
jgi:septum formation protein